MRSHLAIITSLCLSLLLVVGCHHHGGSHASYTRHDAMPLHDQSGHARSLVLTTPAVRTLAESNRRPDPWYFARRDVGPFVAAGTISLRHESSYTVTRDSQHIINGRVFDDYDQTTYRRTYRESTR
jgi:hypothetical protein